MCRSAALHMKYVPLRQMPTHHSHSASLVSRMDFSSQTPAELTRMSRPSNRSTVSATRRSQSATTETSPSTTACIALVAVLARARGRPRGDGPRPLLVPAADGDAHAFFREPEDDRLAEARGAAGDKGHLAVQSAHRPPPQVAM